MTNKLVRIFLSSPDDVRPERLLVAQVIERLAREFAYHLRVKNGYMQLARREPQRIKVVKVAATKEETQQRIRELVLDVI